MNSHSPRTRRRLSLGAALTPALIAAVLALPAAGWAQEGEATPSCHGGEAAAGAHEHAGQEAAADTAGDAEPRLRIPDLDLLDQDGHAIHFYSDLVKDKVVAMNFIFTTCKTVCPPMGANFGRLQEELGDRLGRDVELISVSLDPATDTPQRLKAWAAKFEAGDAWTLVTGPKPDVDQVLRELEVLTPDFKDHGPIVLLVNDRTGIWRRVNGLTPPTKLARMLDEMIDGSPATREEAAR